MAISTKRPPPIRHPQYGKDLKPLQNQDQLSKPWANYYRDLSTGTIGVPNFVDAEVPAGVIDGSNAVFTLANAPNPPESMLLLKNGLKLRAGVAFTLTGKTITFVPARKPQIGDILEVHYRY